MKPKKMMSKREAAIFMMSATFIPMPDSYRAGFSGASDHARIFETDDKTEIWICDIDDEGEGEGIQLERHCKMIGTDDDYQMWEFI